jgi:hypothetical protein
MQVNVKQRCVGAQASPKPLTGQERVRVSESKVLDCRILKVVMMSLKMSKIHILMQNIPSTHTIRWSQTTPSPWLVLLLTQTTILPRYSTLTPTSTRAN